MVSYNFFLFVSFRDRSYLVLQHLKPVAVDSCSPWRVGITTDMNLLAQNNVCLLPSLWHTDFRIAVQFCAFSKSSTIPPAGKERFQYRRLGNAVLLPFVIVVLR